MRLNSEVKYEGVAAFLRRTPVILLICGLFFTLPALINGQPFFYDDTPAYVRGASEAARRIYAPLAVSEWAPRSTGSAQASSGVTSQATIGVTSLEGGVVIAGRSIYYGLFALSTYVLSNFWLMVYVQGICCAFFIKLTVEKIANLDVIKCYLISLILSLFSTIGYFNSMLMPDVFSGLIIVSIVLLILFREKLSKYERCAICFIFIFGMIAHSSHIALASLVTALVAISAMLSRNSSPKKGTAFSVVVACIALAVLSEAAFSMATGRILGKAPLRLPFLTAHLVDMGPGTDYLRATCKNDEFAVCQFREKLPVGWVDFMFATEPSKGVFALASPETKRLLSEEQVRFFVAVLLAYPAKVARGLAVDVFEQIISIRMPDFSYGPERWAYFESRLPPDLWQAMKGSVAFANPAFAQILAAFSYGSAAIGLAFFARFAAAELKAATARDRRLHTLVLFGLLVCGSVLLNAAACAILASPLDRFQARVTWLLPFLGLLAFGVRGSRASGFSQLHSHRRES